MLVQLIVTLSINYLIITVAGNEFSGNETKHHDENNRKEIDLQAFNLSSLSLLGRRQLEEMTRVLTHALPTERSLTYNDLIGSINKYQYFFDDDYDNSEPDEIQLYRQKRAKTSESDIPPSKFIVAGKPTNINAYPWLVYLSIIIRNMYETETTYCGGSLINSKYVVTAAHCLNYRLRSLNDIHLILAEYDTRTHPRDCAMYSNGHMRCVNNVEMVPEQVIMHQRYNPTLLTDDIALIRLRGNAPNSEYIRPISLPNFDIDNPRNSGVELTVAGWGTVYERGPASSVMLDTTVNLVPFAQCRLMTRVPAGKVCAIGIRGQDACHGDSGGPLMAYHQGKYFLAGIVSGKADFAECGSRVPTTYTNVFKYLAWIKQNMRM